MSAATATNSARSFVSDPTHQGPSGGGLEELYQAHDENHQLREKERQIFFWMLRLSQGRIPFANLERRLCEIVGNDDLRVLYEHAVGPASYARTRAQAIIFQLNGIHVDLIAAFVPVFRRTIKRYMRQFRSGGIEAVFPTPDLSSRKYSDPTYKDAIFSILHAPPSDYGFNRTTWRRKDIHAVMASQNMLIVRNYIDRIIHDAGYRFVKARRVLTSNDPLYREKLDKITKILSRLRKDERFFSIDEFGPFAVKEHGGRRLVRSHEKPIVPQFQRSKGCLIITAALELSRNQITHFYSKRKDTGEMLKLLHLLLNEYNNCRKLYLSWDAAGWHASKRFLREIETVNSRSYRKAHRTPLVALAPLPARAQFLNVIESVFSGLAVSIIHNSNYASVDDAKAAIGQYFSDRNSHFRKHPKRAGDKIWGRERVASSFAESQNCKNSRFR